MANGFGSELGFGFWIWDQCGSTEIGDHGDFFFSWFDGGSNGGSDGGVLVWFELMLSWVFFFFFLRFWFLFDGPVGGARICGGDCVLVVAWWWRGGYRGDYVLNCFGFICCGRC